MKVEVVGHIITNDDVYRHIDNCEFKHCKNCEKCLKNKEYTTMGYTYCKECFNRFEKAMVRREDVYVNKEIQYWIGVLTDLFCLDHTPIVILKRRDTRKVHGSCGGRCWWHVTPIVIEVYLDYKGRLPLSLLVHEFIHAMGYDHTWEINGWANFRSAKDNFSRLIVKDLTGKYELML